MSLRKIGFFILILISACLACSKDDGDDALIPIEINDRTEQQKVDDSLLIDYLGRHYYNSNELEALGSNVAIKDIEITELLEGEELPNGNTLLINDVEIHENLIYNDANYKYYILRLNQGSGESPTFADTVRVNYEGFTLDGNVFDSRVLQDSDMAGNIYGWKQIVPQFNASNSSNIIGLDDGTINYSNHGVGIMFMPSGLGYFNATNAGFSYACLIFKFDLLQTFENDHDGDGIPSYIEDINGDEEFISNFVDSNDDTDDDTDGDNLANYIDADDDGDGVLTINELERITYIVNTNLLEEEPELDSSLEFIIDRQEEAGVITIKTLRIIDTDNNNIADYLDEDITIEYN